MKYSLRSLMIGITLFCVLLGGRIEYLRRKAAFHDREAVKFLATRDFQYVSELAYHLYLRDEFRAATYRPWKTVDESHLAVRNARIKAYEESKRDSALPSSSAPASNPPTE
jgi:hypothetical protein